MLRECLTLIVIAALVAVATTLPALAQQNRTADPAPAWDAYSDTWVGVDALGRALPTSDEVGPPRADKTVGIFYFLTFERTKSGPYDNTKILAAHPEALNDIHNPAWGPINTSHYWGEPLFGYYVSDDEFVLRKHAQMLSDAGVDLVIFDNSNVVTYDRARDKLCEVWEQVRREGGRTPQIAFHCPFGNPNGMGTTTMRELYDTVYAPGKYPDLWFRWQGKPLIFADPSYADPAGIRDAVRSPTQLPSEGSLGQSFTVDKPFSAVGGEFPTWGTKGSAMTLSLYAGEGPRGRRIARRKIADVVDNEARLLELDQPAPAGKYYLEISEPVGQVGWWGFPSDMYSGGQSFTDGAPSGGDRTLVVRYSDSAETERLSPNAAEMSARDKSDLSAKLRDFFTFRSPIAPYNLKNPPPNHWAWLQIYPQAPLTTFAGKTEEISVGVAQNYNATVNRTAPMSFPGAFGRSYHDGALDTRPDAVRWGFNVDEQWKRAREVDPPFVFVTGWNEWTAGFYEEWAGFHAPPAVFVDEFTQEFSRDIEPMKGGHGDDYYMQLAADIRRYKGARPLPAIAPHPIRIDADFAQWRTVKPEFRDYVGDTVHRNAPAAGNFDPYVNTTGRNDIVAAKVSYDAKNIYFYVRTHDTLTPPTGNNWMLLFLNTDGDYKTGWLGYDFVVNRTAPTNGKAYIQRCTGAASFAWGDPIAVPCRIVGNEMQLSIPRSVLGITGPTATIDFKWADNCLSDTPDASDFTVNGDAAPDDRFNYRAKIGGNWR